MLPTGLLMGLCTGLAFAGIVVVSSNQHAAGDSYNTSARKNRARLIGHYVWMGSTFALIGTIIELIVR
jgi:hypothetical protein